MSACTVLLIYTLVYTNGFEQHFNAMVDYDYAREEVAALKDPAYRYENSIKEVKDLLIRIGYGCRDVV